MCSPNRSELRPEGVYRKTATVIINGQQINNAITQLRMASIVEAERSGRTFTEPGLDPQTEFY